MNINKEFAEPIINKPVDDSLVLWLAGRGSRREGTLLADLSKKGHHGTLVGSPPWKNTPLGHNVLDFVPNDYVEVADHPDFTFGNGVTDSPFSVSAWIYMDSAANFQIVNKWAADNCEWRLFFSSSRVFFQIFSLNGTNFQGRRYNTALSTGQWYHIVLTYDGSGGATAHDGMKIYVDGVKRDDSDSNSGTYVAIDNGNAPVWVGRQDTTYSDGKIDDVRIYKKELTSNEVMKMYQNTKHFYGK